MFISRRELARLLDEEHFDAYREGGGMLHESERWGIDPGTIIESTMLWPEILEAGESQKKVGEVPNLNRDDPELDLGRKD